MPPVSDRQRSIHVQAARALGQRIAAAADQIEQQRRLPVSVVEALADAGLFRMLMPAEIGGGESDLATFARAIEEIATVDGSTAWCLGQAASSGRMAVLLEREAAERVFGDPGAVVAWGAGQGVAVAVDGGHQLTGHWAFASGIHHATWRGGRAIVQGADGSVFARTDGSRDQRMLLFPMTVAEITDVWQVSGLRGTGSDDYSVRDLFVPAAYTFVWDLTPPQYAGRPLYVFPQELVYALGFSSVAQGIARGALDAFAGFAGTKTRTGATATLSENPVVQSEIARAEATLRAAHAFLHTALAAAWEQASATRSVPTREHMLLRLAATHGIHAAADVVGAVYHAAGSAAIFNSNPFERRLRDINAVTQQVQASPLFFETVGQFVLRGNSYS